MRKKENEAKKTSWAKRIEIIMKKKWKTNNLIYECLQIIHDFTFVRGQPADCVHSRN